MGGRAAMVWRWVMGRAGDGGALQHEFDELNRTDARRHGIHVAAAMVWCFFSLWTTTYVEYAGIPVVLCMLWRARATWRLHTMLIAQPVVVLVSAYWAWQSVTLLWSPDLKLGLKQAGCVRWIWVFPALWPVLDRRRALVGALVCGFLAGNVSQVLQPLGVKFGIHMITWPRLPDRNSGWWDPVIGGTLLTAALGLHVPAAAMGSGRWRLFGILGAGVTIMAIVATGTRGAWIAGAVLLSLGIGAGIWSAPRRERATGAVLIAAGVIAATTWLTAGDAIARRAERARAEISAYFHGSDISTDTGARMAMAGWAVDAFVAHPLGGIGCGGFREWIRERSAAAGVTSPAQGGHAHAHNALLHAAATSGIVGALLGLAVMLVALGNVHRVGRTGTWIAYDVGPRWALLGLGLVSAFDSIQVNSQTCALLMTLLAMCPSFLPRDRGCNEHPTGGAP